MLNHRQVLCTLALIFVILTALFSSIAGLCVEPDRNAKSAINAKPKHYNFRSSFYAVEAALNQPALVRLAVDFNKIRVCCRMHGVRIPRKVVRNHVHRHEWLCGLDNPVLKAQLHMLWIGYDATKEQVGMAKKQFSSYARKYPIIKSWCKLPGVGPIRATTIFAYLDTPWRFKNRAKLHRYCGVGLVRATSGKDKKGRPRPPRLKLPWAVNRRLKNAVIGAATSAIERRDNAFKDYYERMLSNGITPANAKHSVARKMVSTMSAMWKTDSEYDEKLL